MFKGILSLLLLSAAWVTTLWFGLSTDFTRWALPQLVAIHALPPLGAGMLWLGGRRWMQARRERREAATKQAATEQAQAERMATQQQTEEALAQSRFGCDCRGVVMAKLIAAKDDVPLPAARDGVQIVLDTSKTADGKISMVEHLTPGIYEALEHLYAEAPAAEQLPIHVIVPDSVRAADFLSAVRVAQQQVAPSSSLPKVSRNVLGGVHQLPQGSNTLERIIELFERGSCQAAIVLGADAPRLVVKEGDEPLPDGADKPGQAVVALLLTHPEFALESTPSDETSHLLSEIVDRPVLARMHRPAASEGGKRQGKLEFTRQIERLFAEAQRLSGMAEPVKEGVPPESQTPQPCSWIVHNAGASESAGGRLAGLGSALAARGEALDLIDEATNLTDALGDLGDALGASMLALGVAHAAEKRGAALCVDFDKSGGCSMFIIRSPQAAAA